MIIIVAFLSLQLHHLTLLFKLEINSNFLLAFLAIELVIKVVFVQSNRQYDVTVTSFLSSLFPTIISTCIPSTNAFTLPLLDTYSTIIYDVTR